MKPAYQKEDALLEDIRATREAHPDALATWWLGQSGFLVCWREHAVLFDPYLSDSLTEKYKDTDKPHVRMTELAVDPKRLTGIDLVTSSHNHTDHLDRDTLLALREANPDIALVAPEANRAFIAERLGTEPGWPIGSNDGCTTSVGALTLHGIPAAHNELQVNDKGEHQFMGFVLQMGPWTVYHSGDTRLYDGLADRLNRFTIDLAFLPINGFTPERRVAGNLNAKEAVHLAVECDMRHVVPHHFDLFEFNTVEPDEFVREAEQHRLPHTVLRVGQKLVLP